MSRESQTSLLFAALFPNQAGIKHQAAQDVNGNGHSKRNIFNTLV